MALKVFMADLCGGVEYPAPVRYMLQQLFDDAAPGEVSVQWTRRKPQLGQWDMLVYFVKDPDDSILDYGFAKDDGDPDSDGDGWTFFNNRKLVGSEVYVRGRGSNGNALGRLAMHELMHNMSVQGEQMHKPGMSIGADTTKHDAAISDADKKFIAAHLQTTKRTQWTGGFALYNDPARIGM